MDNSEISSTSKLAASLVVIAAVLGMSIGVFKIAKGTSSDGVTEFHKAINTVSESQFTAYDNSVLNGSQIISAWNKFDGENVAILLSTRMGKDLEDNDRAESFEGPGTKRYKSDIEGPLPFVIKAYDKDKDKGEPGEPYITMFSSRTNAELCFVNYGAVLLGSVQDIEASKLVSDDYYEYVGKQDAALYWDKDSWVSNFGFADKNGKVLVNSDTDNIKRSATLEYIKPNAKFQCNLVKANTGEILGIAFEEVG